MLKFDLGDALSSVRFLPNGNLLGLRWWEESCQLVIWTLPSMEETILLEQILPQGIPIQVAYDDGLNWIAVGPPIRQVIYERDYFYPPPLNADRDEQVSISPSGSRMLIATQLERRFATLRENRSIVFDNIYDPPSDYTLLGFGNSDTHILGKRDSSNAIEIQSFDDPDVTSYIRIEPGKVSHFAFCANRTRLVIRCRKTWVVELTDPPKLHQVYGVPYSVGVAGLAIHPTLPIVGIINQFSSAVSLSNFVSQTITQQYDWGLANLDSVDFSPDGLLGMVADNAGNLVIWDMDE